MSLLKPFRPVIPVANNDTSTYYVSLQPVVSGKSTSKFVSSKLTFKSSTNEFLLNNSTIGVKTITSTTKPTNPNLGDIWYDTSTDIQFQYIFDGKSYIWVDISSTTFGGIPDRPFWPIPPQPPLGTIKYLIVGGGGGGGGPVQGTTSSSGGGGGGVVTGCLAICRNSTYNIFVGRGGAGGAKTTCPQPNAPGFAGVASNISGSTITTVTALGGGGGASGNYPGVSFAYNQPECGGSGGGGYGFGTPGTNARAFGSPNYNVAGTQGYPGGSQAAGQDILTGGAGGGGAGGTGGNGYVRNLTAPPFGGNGTGGGGIGYTWPFTANTYAGGGGGGSYPPTAPGGAANYGLGGPGGGGRGGGCPIRLSPGTLNSGGGGGGGGAPNEPTSFGGTGGNGIVVLGIPNVIYPRVSAPGGFVTTPPGAPGMTVLTFTSPGLTTNGTFTLTTS
jgi:hypothetical protein